MKEVSKASREVLENFKSWNSVFRVWPSGRFVVWYEKFGFKNYMVAEGFISDKFLEEGIYSFKALKLGKYYSGDGTVEDLDFKEPLSQVAAMRFDWVSLKACTIKTNSSDRIFIGPQAKSRPEVTIDTYNLGITDGRPKASRSLSTFIEYRPYPRSGNQCFLQVWPRLLRHLPKFDYDAYLTDKGMLVLRPEGGSFTVYLAVKMLDD